jgi:hypothetical protein
MGDVGAVAGAAASEPVVRQARIETIATFDSLVMIEPGAWSPVGTRLVLGQAPAGAGPTRLFVWDPGRPTARGCWS